MQGERSLPRVVDRRYDLWLLNGFNAQEEPQAGGMQRGRGAGPLAKLFCTTKHSLRSDLTEPLVSRGGHVLQTYRQDQKHHAGALSNRLSVWVIPRFEKCAGYAFRFYTRHYIS